MANELEELLRSKVAWQKTQESPYLFKAFFNGKEVRLRLTIFLKNPPAHYLLAQMRLIPMCSRMVGLSLKSEVNDESKAFSRNLL